MIEQYTPRKVGKAKGAAQTQQHACAGPDATPNPKARPTASSWPSLWAGPLASPDPEAEFGSRDWAREWKLTKTYRRISNAVVDCVTGACPESTKQTSCPEPEDRRLRRIWQVSVRVPNPSFPLHRGLIPSGPRYDPKYAAESVRVAG
jgi:hypothetical protein